MGRTVIIIGAGLAGMTAACAARKEGAEVILIDRGSVGLGTNTALAGAVFSGPTATYSTERYIKETIEIGRMLNDRSRVKLVAREATGAINFLRSLGTDLTEFANFYAVRPPNLHEIPGVILARDIARATKSLPGVHVVAGFYVTEIMKEEGRVSGVRGFDRSGGEREIPGSTVIIATGGAGAIYANNDNQKNITGQGYLLSAMAGLELWDMEFVQFYPIVLAEPRLPSMLVYPPYSKEIKLVNASGKNVLAKYDLGDINEAILKKRDEFSEILFREIARNPVYMDCRDVPASSWEVFPMNLLARLKFDFRTRPVKVSPATHFFMGGVRADETGQTSLPGLFACGEIAWGLHGANRRGGNALTECAVTGIMAGSNAAKYAAGSPGSASAAEARPRAASTAGPGGQAVLRSIRGRLRKIAWEKAGIVRSEESLREGLGAVEEIRMELAGIAADDPGTIGLRQDLLTGAFALKAVITASLGRKESRGSFNREDFPREDNENWLKNSCLSYDQTKDSFSLSFHDVA
jgi:succinate dehydrogenase/fumarate reductase flavoprotein subunit